MLSRRPVGARADRRQIGGAGGAGFSPRSLSGVVAWYRGDLGITIANPTLTAPNDVSNAAWLKASCTTPDADTVLDTVDGAPTQHFIHQVPVGIQVPRAAIYTCELKAGTRSWALVQSFSGFSAYFNLATGTIGTIAGAGATASIEAVGGGWYRCTIRGTTAATGNYAIYTASGDGGAAYIGDGTGSIDVRALDVDQNNVSAWANQITFANLALTAPNDLTNAAWVKTNSTAPAADTLQDDGSGGPHYVTQTVTGQTAGRQTRVIAEFLAVGISDAEIQLGGGAVYVNFDVSTRTVNHSAGGATASFELLGDGWTRVTVSGSPSGANLLIVMANASGSIFYAGGAGQIRVRNVSVAQAVPLAQGTAALQPLWLSSGGPGGQAYVDHDTADYMNAAFALVQPEHIFLVARKGVPTANNPSLIDGGGGTGNRMRLYYGGVAPGSNTGLTMTADGANQIVSNAHTATNWNLIEARFNGASGYIRIGDGAAVTGNVGTNGGGGIRLSEFGSTGAACAADFAEVIVASRVLTDSEVALMRSYLKARYGL